MKLLLYISIVAFTTSCASQREVQPFNHDASDQMTSETEEVVSETTTNNHQVVGIVRQDSKGCAFCVETEITPGEFKFLYVVNLEEDFKEDGTKIQFDFALSRAMQPEGCLADMVVTITDVTRLH
ncbi:MAG: hypothetical protein QNK23_18720 [Crocinitomicaceae bacterium]|nr:hypothetical protein [Crocinitomicaceae bacterium]